MVSCVITNLEVIDVQQGRAGLFLVETVPGVGVGAVVAATGTVLDIPRAFAGDSHRLTSFSRLAGARRLWFLRRAAW